MSPRSALQAFGLACAIGLSAGNATAQTPALAARAGIEAALARLDSVSRAGDAAGNADVFTVDAVVSMGTLADIRGRPALQAAMVGFYERYAVPVHRLEVSELEVYGDTAYTRGSYTFVSGPRGGEMKQERGRYAAVWHRGADGRWRMHRYLENLLPATPAP